MKEIWENYFALVSKCTLVVSMDIIEDIKRIIDGGPPYPLEIFDKAESQIFEAMLDYPLNVALHNFVKAIIYR